VVGDITANNRLFTVADAGCVDIRLFGIQAAVRPDGSDAITVEEDGRAKTILYRWTPGASYPDTSRARRVLPK
jgi:hypothetical protein